MITTISNMVKALSEDIIRNGYTLFFCTFKSWLVVITDKGPKRWNLIHFWRELNDYKDYYPDSPWDKYRQELWDKEYDET